MSAPKPEDIEAALPEELREFVLVTCNVKPHEGFPQLCKAIGLAFTRFQFIPIRWREIDLILTDDPPVVHTPSGLLTIVPRKGLAAMAFGDVIFLRASQLFQVEFDFQVIAVLEELTHSLLNVKDESLASWIVAYLYSDRVAYVDGKYASASAYHAHWPPKAKDWEALYLGKDLDVDCLKRKTQQDSATSAAPTRKD